jgi:large subunit ribosomal protein L9
MQVILRQDVEKLGNAGEVVLVKDGYARNFLVPRRLAYVATPGAMKRMEQEMKQILKKIDIEKANLMEVAAKISLLSVTIPMRVGEEERLYGSVTAAKIADGLGTQGFAIDRRNIHIDEAIRTLGAHDVGIKFKHGVTATIKVNVIAE